MRLGFKRLMLFDGKATRLHCSSPECAKPFPSDNAIRVPPGWVVMRLASRLDGGGLKIANAVFCRECADQWAAFIYNVEVEGPVQAASDGKDTLPKGIL